MAVTVFTTIDVRIQVAMATIAHSKSVNKYGLTALKRVIYEASKTQAILQCDNATSVKAVSRATIKELGGLTMRVALTSSSESQRSVEPWLQT